MHDRNYNNWEEYLKELKELHGDKITPEIIYFCRYTWKDCEHITKQSGSSARLIESHSCDKCKWAEWVGQGGMGMVCNKHNNSIDEMFPNDEPINEIGCLQWESKE